MSKVQLSCLGWSYTYFKHSLCAAGLWVLLSSSVAASGAAGGGQPISLATHKIEVHTPALRAKLEAQGAKLIADYGSYQLYEAAQIAPDVLNQPGIESRDQYNIIELHAAPLDTSKPEVQALRKTAGSFSGKHLHLVQFAGPVQPAWRDELVAAGVQIVAYIPENAYLIYGDSGAIAKVQSLAATAPHVQWDGPFLAEYKIHPAARTIDAQGNPRQIGTDLFAIQLVADNANAATLQLIDQLKLEPLKKENAVLGYLNVIARLDPATLTQLAAQPDLLSIQPYFVPKKLCERQDQILAGNLTGNVPSGPGYLNWLQGVGFSQGQFSTSGFAVDVTDSGVDDGTTTPNHPGLYVKGDTTQNSRVIYNRLEGTPNPNSTLVGCDGHGTINAHIIGGYNDLPIGFPFTDSSGFHYGLGVCPFVKIGSTVIFDPDNYTFPDFTAVQSAAYQNGARVSANSWGGGVPGEYNVDSQEYDALVRDAQPSGAPISAPGNQEMCIVFAAGNDGEFGSQTVSSPGTGKNVITVGAGENVQPFGGPDGSGIDDTGADSANDVIFFSSRGPCSDLRHKPDIMSPGTHVSGGVAQAPSPGPTGTADPCFNGSGVSGGPNNSLFWPLGQQFYTSCSGTSQATPGAAGSAALVRQYFINNFTNPPSPAMTKAFLMNTARYMTGLNANDTLWSDNEGMGEVNLSMAFDNATPRVLRDELPADLFTATGQARYFTNAISDPTKPFRVTLAWTDAPGNTAGNAYNNNLDLTVYVGNNVYKGNNFNGRYSVTGGSADFRDNVESVSLPAGNSGFVTIAVTAANINSDGVPNNGSPLDQDFALVAYNATLPPPTVSGVVPASLTLINGQPATFTLNVTGIAPFSYQWRKNGANIAGATLSSYSIAAVTTNDAGAYSAVVTNSYGSALSPVAALTVIQTLPLPFALDNSNLTWTTDISTTPWFGQAAVSHDGIASARSYFIGNNQRSTLTTTVTGPGTLSFWWKVSSQANGDTFTFSDVAPGVNNAVTISGEVDWNLQQVYLPAGLQTLQWVYAKNGSGTAGSDTAWLDQVSFVAGPTAPFITRQPTGNSIIAGGPITFSVVADGTPVLTYQWQLNGVNIPGATSSSLSIPNAGVLDSGTYTVLISNAYGSLLSSGAYLGIVPLVGRGDNSLGQLNVSLVATNAVAIAAGSWHSLLLRGDSSILAWGENYDGQCNVPNTLVNPLVLAGGGYHSLALQANGTVVGWGANYDGQATPPAGLTNVIAIAAGTWHSLALRSDGTVVGWGDNSLGQAIPPAGLANVIAIAAGGSHSLALRSDGTVVAWGENTDANGNFVGQSIVPAGLAKVVAIGAGEYHSLAVKADGTLVAWGDNSQGQCQPPQPLTNAIAAAGGSGHTVVLKADSTILCWGNDWNGQCDFPAGTSNVVAIAAGSAHTLLLEGNRFGLPHLLRPTRSGNQFSVLVQTQVGSNYALEYSTSLNPSNWISLTTLKGDGALHYLLDTTATGPQRFYRVRQF